MSKMVKFHGFWWKSMYNYSVSWMVPLRSFSHGILTVSLAFIGFMSKNHLKWCIFINFHQIIKTLNLSHDFNDGRFHVFTKMVYFHAFHGPMIFPRVLLKMWPKSSIFMVLWYFMVSDRHCHGCLGIQRYVLNGLKIVSKSG